MATDPLRQMLDAQVADAPESPAKPSRGPELADLLVEHDVDDTADLLRRAAAVDPDRLTEPGRQTTTGLPFGDQEPSVLALLRSHVRTKEIWLAAVRGESRPDGVPEGIQEITARHRDVAPRWRAWVREVGSSRGWGESIVDAREVAR